MCSWEAPPLAGVIRTSVSSTVPSALWNTMTKPKRLVNVAALDTEIADGADAEAPGLVVQ